MDELTGLLRGERARFHAVQNGSVALQLGPRIMKLAAVVGVENHGVQLGHRSGGIRDSLPGRGKGSLAERDDQHHSDGQATLRLRRTEDGGLRVSVWDTNPLIPAPFDRPPGALTLLSALSPAADTAECGRGLLLVRQCADNWGGYPLGHDLFGRSGKLLWFELTPKPELVRAA